MSSKSLLTAEDYLSLSLTNEIEKETITHILKEMGKSDKEIEDACEKIENKFVNDVERLHKGLTNEEIHKI